jgi:hypothetical protein
MTIHVLCNHWNTVLPAMVISRLKIAFRDPVNDVFVDIVPSSTWNFRIYPLYHIAHSFHSFLSFPSENQFDIMSDSSEQQIQYFEARYLDPKFPIIKTDPSVDDVINSLRTSDYLFVSGTVGGTWAYGYLLGKPVRGPTAVMCASAGFTFGMFYTMQTVRSRLLGYRENSKEVKKWGMAQLQPRTYTIGDRRFPVRQPLTSKPPLNWDNYD